MIHIVQGTMIKNTMFLIVVGFLLGWILFFKVGFNPAGNTASMVNDTVTVTVVDTVKIPVYEKWKAPKPVAVIGSGLDEKKIYTRKIIADSLGGLEITDTLQNNMLLGYSVAGKINLIREVQKISISKPSAKHNKLLVGAYFSYTPTLLSIYPAVTFETKKGLAVTGGYDFINKIAYGGISKVITFRKR